MLPCLTLTFDILLCLNDHQTLLEYLQRHLAVASSSSHGGTRGGLDVRDPITRRCPALAKVCLLALLPTTFQRPFVFEMESMLSLLIVSYTRNIMNTRTTRLS